MLPTCFAVKRTGTSGSRNIMFLLWSSGPPQFPE